MIVLTLAEAFDRAKAAAPGISEEDFLDQTRVLLQHSRIKASAARAVIRHDNETYEPIPEHCAASELDAREQIPADAWVNLALWFSNGGSASGWGHKHALPDKRGFPEDGYFEGREVYVSVVLIAESLNGLWTAPKIADNSKESDDTKAMAIIRANIEKRGGFIGQNHAAQIVREKLPDFPRDRARKLAKTLTGNEKTGPRGPRKNHAE